MNTQRWVGLHTTRISHITECSTIIRPRNLIFEKLLNLTFKFFNSYAVDKTLSVGNTYVYLYKASLPILSVRLVSHDDYYSLIGKFLGRIGIFVIPLYFKRSAFRIKYVANIGSGNHFNFSTSATASRAAVLITFKPLDSTSAA